MRRDELYTGSGHGGTLTEIPKGAHMNELDKLLNAPDSSNPKSSESIIPKKTEKLTAAANKALYITDQENSIAAASAGSHIYRSAANFLADNPEVKGFKK
jgi:hypothetical protein